MYLALEVITCFYLQMELKYTTEIMKIGSSQYTKVIFKATGKILDPQNTYIIILY